MKELRAKIAKRLNKQQHELSYSIQLRKAAGNIEVTDMTEPINQTIMKQATRIATLKHVLGMIDCL